MNLNRHFNPVVTLPTLSVEEEAILIDEQNQAVTEINETLNDDQRVTDTQATLADAEVALGEADQVGDVEASLASAVADMAVAGTDANPEELVPTTPSAEVTTEGFAQNIGERLKKIWEAIKAFLEKIWGKIKAFFRNIVAFFSRTDKKGKVLEEQLKKEKGGDSNNEKVRERGSIMRSIYALTRGTDYDLAEASKAFNDMDLEKLRRIEQDIRNNQDKLKTTSTTAKANGGSSAAKSAPAAAAAPEAKPKQPDPFEFIGYSSMLCMQQGKILKGSEFVRALKDTRDYVQNAIYAITEHTLLQMELVSTIAHEAENDLENYPDIMLKYGKLYVTSQEKMMANLKLDPKKSLQEQTPHFYLNGICVVGGPLVKTGSHHEDSPEWSKEFTGFHHMAKGTWDKVVGEKEHIEPLGWQEGKEVREIQKSWSAVVTHRDTQSDLKNLTATQEKMEASLKRLSEMSAKAMEQRRQRLSDFASGKGDGNIDDISRDAITVFQRLSLVSRTVSGQAAMVVRLFSDLEHVLNNAVEYASQSSKWRFDNGIKAA